MAQETDAEVQQRRRDRFGQIAQANRPNTDGFITYMGATLGRYAARYYSVARVRYELVIRDNWQAMAVLVAYEAEVTVYDLDGPDEPDSKAPRWSAPLQVRVGPAKKTRDELCLRRCCPCGLCWFDTEIPPDPNRWYYGKEAVMVTDGRCPNEECQAYLWSNGVALPPDVMGLVELGQCAEDATPPPGIPHDHAGHAARLRTQAGFLRKPWPASSETRPMMAGELEKIADELDAEERNDPGVCAVLSSIRRRLLCISAGIATEGGHERRVASLREIAETLAALGDATPPPPTDRAEALRRIVESIGALSPHTAEELHEIADALDVADNPEA